MAITTGRLGALDHMKFSISNQKRLSKTVIGRLNWESAIILAHHPLPIAQQLQDIIEIGDLDGFVLTFPDFIGDLTFFGRRVLPLLAQAGFA